MAARPTYTNMEIAEETLTTPDLRLDVTPGSGPRGLTGPLFARRALSQGALHLERRSWPTDAEELPMIGTVLASCTDHRRREVLVADADVLAVLRLHRSAFSAELAAPTPAALEEMKALLLERVPVARVPEDRRAVFRFWAGGSEVAAISKRLPVQAWTEIERNYAGATREQLDRLVGEFGPDEGGKLLLWHGEPGTGKTYALRTLAWEWWEWCDFHYVIDPEVLLGPNSGYLVCVLLDATERIPPLPPDLAGSGRSERASSRWRLLILEDCGELLAADAKAATGQALARLLNLTDGLIGDGFKTLVLITTNEPVRRMHAARTRGRPGRLRRALGGGVAAVVRGPRPRRAADARDAARRALRRGGRPAPAGADGGRGLLRGSLS
jgi:hypothetical protein